MAFGIETDLLHNILAVHKTVVCHAGSRNRVDLSVLGRHLLPKRRRMLPPLPVLVDPFVERIRETLFYVVAQDVKPGLVHVGRTSAGESEHELCASAAARENQSAPLFRIYAGVLPLERIQRLGRGILRMVRTVAHEERHVRRGGCRQCNDSRDGCRDAFHEHVTGLQPPCGGHCR